MFRRRRHFAVPSSGLFASALLASVVLLAAGCGDPALRAADRGDEVGLEHGLPYWVWRALPQVFPEYVPGPGGYLAFGFDWNLGELLPVGLEMEEGAVPRIRSDESAVPGVPPGPVGVGGGRPDLEAYRDFLVAVGRDPRFTAENLMPHIQYDTRLSGLRRAQYRWLLIPRTREALLRLEAR